MKVFILFFFCYFITSNITYSQTAILVGTSENTVRNYMDSLFRLKNNPYYKIEQQTDQYGDLLLIADFSIYDFDFYKCNSIFASFHRIKGVEVCTRQMVTGKIEHAQLHLSFIKDNFKYVSDNKWETESGLNPDYKIEAEYGKKDKDFYITYTIRKK